MFPVTDVAGPLHKKVSAARQCGTEFGIVGPVKSEVVGLKSEVGDGESEEIGQGVVGIDEAGVGDGEIVEGEGKWRRGLGGLKGIRTFGALGGVLRFR